MVVNAETFIGKDEGVQAQRAIRNQQRIQKATTNNNYYERINWSRCNQIDEAKRLRNYRCVWCVVRINILESVQRSLLRQPAHALTLTAQHFFVCFVMILYFQLINWVSFVLFLIFFFFLVRMPQIDMTKSSGNEFLASAHSTTNDICKIYLNSRELSVIPYAIDAHSHQSMIIFLLLFKRNIFKTPRTRFVYDF